MTIAFFFDQDMQMHLPCSQVEKNMCLFDAAKQTVSAQTGCADGQFHVALQILFRVERSLFDGYCLCKVCNPALEVAAFLLHLGATFFVHM